MTLTERMITIGMFVLATMATRFLPFLLLSGKRETPPFVKYLGTSLAPMVFGLLVIYSLRNVSLLSGTHGIPEALAIVLVIVLHLWKRQMILSIAGGTIGYMLLVQYVF